jgi:hypothetical protein
MKLLKIGLRTWIGSMSVISFLGGWALLSHSGKPVPLIQTPEPAPTAAASQSMDTPQLAPIPSVNDLVTTNLQPLPSLPSSQTQSFFPRLRTRGS